jgi:hypothetical protein
MDILAFLIIGVVWAAFLLPAFFESSKSASLRSTRSFARHNDLLASVALQSAATVRAARVARHRRSRTVAMLGSGALGSLAASVITGNALWLGVTIVFDILLAGFVTALLQAKAARFRTVAPVVELGPGSSTTMRLGSSMTMPTEIEAVPTIRIVGA